MCASLGNRKLNPKLTVGHLRDVTKLFKYSLIGAVLFLGKFFARPHRVPAPFKRHTYCEV